MSLTFDDWLDPTSAAAMAKASPPFGLSLFFVLASWSRQCRVELRATVGQIGGGSA
jgi:hypothetical protein